MRKQDRNWIDYLYILVVWVCSYPRSLILNIYQGIFRLLNLYKGFKIDDEGKLVKYTGKGGHVIIPDGVTSIGRGAFSGCTSLASIVIPYRIESVGAYAFLNCQSLESIVFLGRLKRIPDFVFKDCISLKSFVIPDGVRSIGW